MTPFPRPDYDGLGRYTPDRRPVEVDLSDNTNLWGTHPAALEVVRNADVDALARYPELYSDRLRDAVGGAFDIDPDCVTTGCGSDDVLDSAFRAAAGPGSSVSYAAPTFSMVEPLARMNGMEARPVPWAEALDDPARMLRDDPSVVYVCRPNNPTGEHAPAEWLDALIDAVDRAGPVRPGSMGPLMILDEAYADFAGETLIGRAPSHPRLLVARTASKAYGLAGLRTGFAVASPEVTLEIDKSRGPYKVTALGAAAAAAALEDADGWMADVIAQTVVNRERLWGELDARGLRPLSSRSNFILCAAPGGDDEAGTPDGARPGQARAAALALRDHGVAVRPFEGIPGLDNALRVTVGPWPLMERFLAAVDAVMAGRAAGGAPDLGADEPAAGSAR